LPFTAEMPYNNAVNQILVTKFGLTQLVIKLSFIPDTASAANTTISTYQFID